MINYYALYDNSLKLSNPPFACNDDISAKRLVRNMLISASDDVFTKIVSITSLVFVGRYDEVDAKFIPAPEMVKVCDLCDIPLPAPSDNSGGDQ